MDFENSLLNVLQQHNIYIDGEINWFVRDFQRFRVKNSWKRGKPLFVCLHGDGATFGDWRNPATWRTWWYRSWQEISREEKARRVQELERLEHEKRLKQSHAIWRANEMLHHQTWRGPTCVAARADHPYVSRKKIIPYYAFQIRSYLIIPIFDLNGALLSLQYIKPNGDKRFKKHASPKGGFAFLGETIKRDIDTLWICEGWATGCSIYDAVGEHVICSLGASNLEAVAFAFRIKYPGNKIVICADNDAHLKKNVGVEIAKEVARKSASFLRVPSISGDWNDLAIKEGIGEARRQLLNL